MIEQALLLISKTGLFHWMEPPSLNDALRFCQVQSTLAYDHHVMPGGLWAALLLVGVVGSRCSGLRNNPTSVSNFDL